jgi:hypothetical protein
VRRLTESAIALASLILVAFMASSSNASQTVSVDGSTIQEAIEVERTIDAQGTNVAPVGKNGSMFWKVMFRLS